MQNASIYILILLLHAMPDAMLGVARLGRDGDKIRSGIQMAEVVAAFIIGVGVPHLKCAASSACKNLAEEHDIRMTDGIVGLIRNVSGNGSARPQTESQILRFESRSDDDRGHKILVLLIHLRKVTTMARGKDILARRHAGKGKKAFRIRNLDTARIGRAGGILKV